MGQRRSITPDSGLWSDPPLAKEEYFLEFTVLKRQSVVTQFGYDAFGEEFHRKFAIHAFRHRRQNQG